MLALLCFLPVYLMQSGEAQTTVSPMANPSQIQTVPQSNSQPRTSDGINRTLGGTVTDEDGALLPGASVTLLSGGQSLTMVTNAAGHFNFSNVAAGPYTLKIKAKGMESHTESGTLNVDESLDLPPIALTITVSDQIVVSGLTQHELAQKQMKQEETQRVIGVIPNFYVAYNWNAAPLSPGQKFNLAFRSIADPAIWVLGAGLAGFQQMTNQFSGYGSGWQGYGKRYGAVLANRAVGGILGGAVFPIVFRQDPRYFYKGTGTTWQRTWYAISRAVIERGDNGKWQPAYSNVLGDFSAGAISNLYYPASNQTGVGLTLENGSVDVGFNALENLMQEFVLKKFTSGWKKHPAPTPP